MVTAYWTAFLLGFAGSLHCIGMCGPLALALPAPRNATHATRAYGRLLYNLGRTLTYATFGLFAGALGHILQLGGFQRAVSILLGLLLLATLFLSTHHIPSPLLNTFYRPLQHRLGNLLAHRSPGGFLKIGLLNGLLPCGLVYSALAIASLQHGPARSAAYMTLFGLGTLPVMFALSMGGLSLHSPRMRSLFQYLVPALTLIAGTLLILRGLALGIPYISPDLQSAPCCAP